MLRALIVDFDGLIIDSETAISATWIELYDGYGLPLPEHLWRKMIGTREHDDLLWTDLAEQTGLTLDVPGARTRAPGPRCRTWQLHRADGLLGG
jgi:beta-phosphoglucomutase-like phosphatase (HAD superfamily)